MSNIPHFCNFLFFLLNKPGPYNVEVPGHCLKLCGAGAESLTPGFLTGQMKMRPLLALHGALMQEKGLEVAGTAGSDHLIKSRGCHCGNQYGGSSKK